MSKTFRKALRAGSTILGASAVVAANGAFAATEKEAVIDSVAINEIGNVLELAEQADNSLNFPSAIVPPDATINLADTTLAQAQPSQDNVLEQLNRYGSEGRRNSLDQVTNVNQLRDVSPGDWAYEALRNLVETYGCIAGYPDGTYRGNRAMTRYEFAAGLNACLQQIERLIAASTADFVTKNDLATLQRLMEEFEAELATLGTRVDNLEGRVAFLEDNQFSTTTKLQGEVVFGLTTAFDGTDDDQVTFQDRVRLAFVSSFTGRDQLYTRLDAGNAAFPGGLDQGALTFNFNNGNNIDLGWLAYYFPIGEKISVYLPAAFPLWQDFVPTLSDLDDFTGASGALSSFAESSPIYKIGLASGGGIGANFSLSDALTISAGYFGGDSFDPSDGNGLFNGEYSALGQITFSPSDSIKVAFTYVNAYFNDLGGGNAIFDTGVGTANARQPFGAGADVRASTNSYGIQGYLRLSESLSLNAFGLYTDVSQENGGGDEEIWSYGLGIALPDLGKEGNLGGIVVGAEPYVGGQDDTALHIEGFYKYQVSDNISITPGVVWITAPFGDQDNDDAIIGTIRTTFKF